MWCLITCFCCFHVFSFQSQIPGKVSPQSKYGGAVSPYFYVPNSPCPKRGVSLASFHLHWHYDVHCCKYSLLHQLNWLSWIAHICLNPLYYCLVIIIVSSSPLRYLSTSQWKISSFISEWVTAVIIMEKKPCIMRRIRKKRIAPAYSKTSLVLHIHPIWFYPNSITKMECHNFLRAFLYFLIVWKSLVDKPFFAALMRDWWQSKPLFRYNAMLFFSFFVNEKILRKKWARILKVHSLWEKGLSRSTRSHNYLMWGNSIISTLMCNMYINMWNCLLIKIICGYIMLLWVEDVQLEPSIVCDKLCANWDHIKTCTLNTQQYLCRWV